MKHVSLFILFIIALSFASSAQSVLVYEEDPQKASRFRQNVPEGKVLIIVESELNLSFESTMELLDEPQKEGSLYKLYLSHRVCILEIEDEESGTKLNIPFGQMSSPERYPALQFGEVKYYTIKGEWQLRVISEDREGDNQMRYEREALLILTVDPPDLELEFKSTTSITEIDKDRNRYRLYIQPNMQFINIKHPESGAYFPLEIDNVETKEVRYYYVSLPHSLRQVEVQAFDQSITTGSYRVESTPPGATIQILGNPSFNRENNKTPFTFEGYRTGSQIISLTLNKYETVTDTIHIGTARVNRSSFELIPVYAFLRFNITPAPPTSRVFLDNERESIRNQSNFEVRKGDRRVRVEADHFYPEHRIVRTQAGEEHPVNVTLRPIMGKLMLTAGRNASGADVYIESAKLQIRKKNIGKLPFRQTFDLQEGEYTMTIEKSGFGTIVQNITIQENQTLTHNIDMVNAFDMVIKSNVNNAEVFVNNRRVGKTNERISIAIGRHPIKLVHPYYLEYKGHIDIKATDPDGKEHFLLLQPKEYSYRVSADQELIGKNKNLLYINDFFIDTLPASVNLKTGQHKIRITSGEERKFESTINVPVKRRNLHFPLYTNFNASLVDIDFQSVSFLNLMFYGIKVSLADAYFFETPDAIRDDDYYSGYFKIEGKIGGGLTRNIDICFFANYNSNIDYQNPIVNGLDTTWVSADSGHIHSFGIEILTRPKMLHVLSFYLKAGLITSTLNTPINGVIKPNNQPYISLGASWSMGGDNILRLWKRPISHRFW